MPSFDPSVLAEIPAYAPNPVKAQSDAYTLAGQQQGVQLNAIDLQEKRQQQQDEAKVRELLKGADLSSFEGQTKAAQEITKINPKMGMDFMARVQQSRQQQQYTLTQLQTADAQVEALAGAIDPVVAQLDQLSRQPGMTPAMLDAKAKQLVIPAALQLRNQRPDLAPTIDKFLQDPNSLTYQGVRSADEQTKRGSQALKERLAERKQAELERENRARDVRGDAGGGGLSPAGQALKDDLAARDPSFMARAGAKSIQQQNRILEDWAKQGRTADDIIGSRQATKGTSAEVSALYKQKANIERTEKSILGRPGKPGFLDMAEEAVKEVDLISARGLGDIDVWIKKQGVDPAIRDLGRRLMELRAEYAIVLSKGGQITNEAREEAKAVVDDYVTTGDFARMRKTITGGIAASRSGVEDSISEATKQPPSPSSPTAAPAGGVAPFSDPEKEKRYQEWKRTHPGG